MDTDDDILIRKAKAMCTSKAKRKIHSLFLISRADIQPLPGKQDLSTADNCLGK